MASLIIAYTAHHRRGAPRSSTLRFIISTVSSSLSIFGSVILGQFGLGLSIFLRFHGFGIIERCFWFDHLWCWKLVEIGIGLEFAICLSCFEYFKGVCSSIVAMTFTDNQGSSSPFRAMSRSIFGAKREQVHSIEGKHESSADQLELESFQKQVTDRFNDLLVVDADELLSLAWLQKLLDAFVCCHEEFRVILLKNKELISKPPLDRLVAEFFERSLKALDICNATRDGIEKIRMWQKHLEIVLCALDSRQRAIGEGQLRRARKALMDLALTMLEEKDSGSVFSQRNRSFGHHNTSKDHHRRKSGHSRSLSWSVSPSWSATKQLQSIANNLMPPRGNEIAATNGFAIPIFAMSSVLVFVLWTLVAAIPCQDRGLNVHFSIPRQFSWGTPLHLLHDRIMEESKKREQRNSNGLLKEILSFDRCTRQLTDLVDFVHIPLPEEQKVEIDQGMEELSLVCEAFKNGLDPLERQVKEVFRKIMNMRTEGLEFLGRGSE
ncbi:hypothetical protein QYF36_021057 [Acer negundo]|nr:hypothetical protein QYF36_006509 [Acer negundo]KAK4846705.1 hypothetical protein QYF36_021057 [Acer negundo]